MNKRTRNGRVWARRARGVAAIAASMVLIESAFCQGVVPGGKLEATSRCGLEFIASAELSQSKPVPLPRAGGAVWSKAELAVWDQRARGRSAANGDGLERAEQGDWARLQASAARLLRDGEAPIESLDAGRQRWTQGSLARDAAFVFKLNGDAKLLAAVRGFLKAQVADPSNNIAALCVRPVSGPVRDAWFGEAGWLLRQAVTYDYVRDAMPADERVTIENWLRRNVYALAAQLDWGLEQVFPRRSSGDMSARAGAAAAQGEARWMKRRYDTNGDCKIDAADDPREFPATAYSHDDGSAGPRLSLISQYYNNRRSASAAAMGVVGVMLGDEPLIRRSRRYFDEWLAYSVWPDGSEGEFSRNGDYCIANQGVIYGASNSQAMTLVAWALARQGDKSLFDVSTREGLFGSEATARDEPKSLALVTRTLLNLRSGSIKWFYFEPWRERQEPRPETSLGDARGRYMNGSSQVDNFHELGMWLAAPYLRLPAVRSALVDRARGWSDSASAPNVVTGLGVRTDALNALPAVVLLRP